MVKNFKKYLKTPIQLSTHTLRKTAAYHLYKETNDISLVMSLLQHSNAGLTLRYLGIRLEQVYNPLINLFE
jgi:integrase